MKSILEDLEINIARGLEGQVISNSTNPSVLDFDTLISSMRKIKADIENTVNLAGTKILTSPHLKEIRIPKKILAYKDWHKDRKYRERINKKWLKRYGTISGSDLFIYSKPNTLIVSEELYKKLKSLEYFSGEQKWRAKLVNAEYGKKVPGKIPF